MKSDTQGRLTICVSHLPTVGFGPGDRLDSAEAREAMFLRRAGELGWGRTASRVLLVRQLQRLISTCHRIPIPMSLCSTSLLMCFLVALGQPSLNGWLITDQPLKLTLVPGLTVFLHSTSCTADLICLSSFPQK